MMSGTVRDECIESDRGRRDVQDCNVCRARELIFVEEGSGV